MPPSMQLLYIRDGDSILSDAGWDDNTMKTRSFTILVYQEEDMYIAECPEVGTVDQGETVEEAIAGLKEATRLYWEGFPLESN